MATNKDRFLKAMRKIFSTKAGATFNMETPKMTFCVRKDAIEIIYKVRAGIYININLCRVSDKEGMLFADWGTYFSRVSNPQVQLPKVKKCCPTLYSLMVGENQDGINEMDFGMTEGTFGHGFGMRVKIPEKTGLLFCLDDNVIDHATIMANNMLKVYNELVDNPPFPAWKTGLDEVWE